MWFILEICAWVLGVALVVVLIIRGPDNELVDWGLFARTFIKLTFLSLWTIVILVLLLPLILGD